MDPFDKTGSRLVSADAAKQRLGWCSPPLLATAFFAYGWTVARAARQSITIDEADSYLAFVAPGLHAAWQASSANHVLNSALMHFSTALFGASHLAVRAPALLGALLYIGAAYFLSLWITRRPLLRWSLFVCLACNPFVMDYLVAARGYSLAMGCLLAAIALAVGASRGPDPWRRPERTFAAVSLLLGLSFTANYAFGFVNAAVGLLFLWRPWREAERSAKVRLAAAAILPGALAALALVGRVLRASSMREFPYGATSLREMAASVVHDSLFEPASLLTNPQIRDWIQKWNWIIPALLLGAGLWRLGMVVLDSRNGEEQSRWLRRLAACAAGALALSIGVHWLLFRSIHLLLPWHRTAVYIAPLLTLALGALAAAPFASRAARLSARAASAAFLITALYFLCCLRLTYFKEWGYCADADAAYRIAARYSHQYGIRNITVCWKYFASVNFYHAQSGREPDLSFDIRATDESEYRKDREVYILEPGFDDKFIDDEKLTVVYRGPISDLRVAVRPSLAR